jgi:hypothetical protein
MDKIPEVHPADQFRLETALKTTEIPHDKDNPGQDLMAMATADTGLDSHLVHMELSEA